MNGQNDEVRQRVRSPDPMLGRTRPSLRPISIERVPGTPAHLKGDIDPPTKPKRQRVVLDDGIKTPATGSLRSRVELAQQTSWGEMLIKDLIRAMLRSGVLIAVVALLVLLGLPLAFWLVPAFAGFSVVGVPVAWLLLAVAPFPLLAVAGLWYSRVAERHERAFVDMIEN